MSTSYLRATPKQGKTLLRMPELPHKRPELPLEDALEELSEIDSKTDDQDTLKSVWVASSLLRQAQEQWCRHERLRVAGDQAVCSDCGAEWR